ncbi:hypothetical protein JCM10207_007660 [Rhodosporidiobolus poonsookiae]
MPSPLSLSLAAFALAAPLATASPLARPPSLGNTLDTRSSQPQPLSVNLKRRANAHSRTQRRDATSYRKHAQGMRSKYGGWAPNSKHNSTTRAKRQQTIDMTTYTNSEWYGEIDVGTPPAGFSVVLDTGSSDLILAEPNCNGCESSTPGYDPSSSSTSSETQSSFQITYGSGSGSGELVSDVVSIANYSQPNQVFAACSTLDNIVDGEISGILGLGWASIASSQAVPLVQSLADNGTLPEQVFGFAFETGTFTTASSVTAPGGTLTIGGVDTSAYSGEINWIDIVQPEGYWQIPLEGITVGGTSTGITSDAVVIDTGTTLIGMPSDQVATIYDSVPNSQPIVLDGEDGYYAFPCSQDVEVSFQFGGQTYAIDPDQFNAGAVDNRGRLCLGAVFALETGSSSISTIVGDAFLTGVYNAYRFAPTPAVGFATLGSGGTANTGSSATSSGTGNGAVADVMGGGRSALVGGAMAALGVVAALFA